MKLNFTYLVCGSAAIFYNFLAALPSYAVDITWDLNGVQFSDGSTATGYFTYDGNTPIDADITLTEGNTQVTFTSGDLGTTFATSNSTSVSSTYNRLVLCSNPSNSTCPSSSTVLVLASTDNFGNAGGTDVLSKNGANAANNSFYYNGISKSGLSSGVVNQIPFNIPGGEGSVLLGGVLAMGAVRRLKNYSSSTKIANSTGSKVVG